MDKLMEYPNRMAKTDKRREKSFSKEKLRSKIPVTEPMTNIQSSILEHLPPNLRLLCNSLQYCCGIKKINLSTGTPTSELLKIVVQGKHELSIQMKPNTDLKILDVSNPTKEILVYFWNEEDSQYMRIFRDQAKNEILVQPPAQPIKGIIKTLRDYCIATLNNPLIAEDFDSFKLRDDGNFVKPVNKVRNTR